MPVMLIVAAVVFSILVITPGSPAEVMLGEFATPEQIQQLEDELGLNRPIVVQIGVWVSKAFRGDLGTSLYYGEPVLKTIIGHSAPTLHLTLMALTLSVVIGIPIGILSASFHNTLLDSFLTFIGSLGLSVPSAWLGLMLVLTFSLKYPVFPVSGYVPPTEGFVQSMYFMILPAICLGLSPIARIARMTRANVLDILSSDYVRTARAKGLMEVIVLFKHTLKNALVPVLTVIGLSLANMMGGAVIVEQIFLIPGIGRMLIFSVSNRDYPMVQGIVLYIAAIYVLINLAIDIIYVAIDPRISYS